MAVVAIPALTPTHFTNVNIKGGAVLYLAIDPGERTGWAEFIDGTPTEMGEVKGKEEFYVWLFGREQVYEHIVGEQYIIRPPHAGGFDHQWGKVPTLRVLGGLEAYCAVRQIPLHYQDSTVLTPGSARFNLPHPKNSKLPNRNAISAVIHGKWWWETKGKTLANEQSA